VKIIWYSADPSTPWGYGTVSREICKRIQSLGHEVTIATRAFFGPPRDVLGIPVFTGVDSGLVNFVNEEEHYDYVVMTSDPKQGTPIFNNWVALAAFDFEFAYDKLIRDLGRSKFQVCVSKHNQKELERVGFKPYYCPYGVDTKFYKPDSGVRNDFRKKMGWSNDQFVIGAVGSNLPNDRKNHLGLLKAFQKFAQDHDDVVLYFHTDVIGAGCIPLQRISVFTGVNDRIYWVDQKKYHMYAVSQEEMLGVYNGIDVLCLPTKGESFGLPIVEAQACGTPVVTTQTTSGPELMKGGWLIPVDDDDLEWLEWGSWEAKVRPLKIADTLEWAYKCWKGQDEVSFKNLSNIAYKSMAEYDWDVVFNTYWKPFLSVLEAKK
jgi:glycosyltransferase involved in cell wall biosynthesis